VYWYKEPPSSALSPHSTAANMGSFSQISQYAAQIPLSAIRITDLWHEIQTPETPKYETGLLTCQRDGDKRRILGELKRLSGRIYRKVASCMTAMECYRR